MKGWFRFHRQVNEKNPAGPLGSNKCDNNKQQAPSNQMKNLISAFVSLRYAFLALSLYLIDLLTNHYNIEYIWRILLKTVKNKELTMPNIFAIEFYSRYLKNLSWNKNAESNITLMEFILKQRTHFFPSTNISIWWKYLTNLLDTQFFHKNFLHQLKFLFDDSLFGIMILVVKNKFIPAKIGD